MRLAVISFTKHGSRLCRQLTKGFLEMGEECQGYLMERYYNVCHEEPGLIPFNGSPKDWTGRQFEDKDGIVFVGAAGIAVRLVAPFLRGKTEDPAVVVIDEQGHFSISLLSGHIGGANDLAVLVSEITGAVPVITTATDLNRLFAVDVFATKNHLYLSDMGIAKRVSADLLDGKYVGFYSDFPVEGTYPEGLTQKELCSRAVWVTVKRRTEPDSFLNLFTAEDTEILRLVPKAVCLGIGCRKNTEKERIAGAVEAFLKENNLDKEGIARIASIDLKKEEMGLTAFARESHLPFITYTAQELECVPGTFTASDFVRKVTGVDNVCERAAVAGAKTKEGWGILTAPKKAGDGVTIAAAVSSLKVIF